MDSPVPALDERVPNLRPTELGRLLFALGLILYGILLAVRMGAYAGGSDSSGYLNNARLLREGRVRIERRAIENLPAEKVVSYAYIPLGFIPVRDHEMVPTYPVGISAMIAAVSFVTGWGAAAPIVMWLHGILGVWLFFALARHMGLSFFLSAFGTLLLAGSPLYLFMSVQAMSDTPSLVWCTAAVLFAWKSRLNPRWALAAGSSIAVAVLVRPSNLLVIVPVAFLLGTSWRRWLSLIVGGTPGAVFLGAINFALYGNALTTGYGAVGGIFSGEYVAPALRNYTRWLPVLLTPGLVLVVVAPWLLRRESAQLRLTLMTWPLVFFVFYAFYYHTQEAWWYLRFLLPAFPPIILIMLLAARTIDWSWLKKSPRVAMLVMLGGALSWQIFWTNKLSALSSGKNERVYPHAAEWARSHLPGNAVVLAMQMSGALHFYTPFIFARWDEFSAKTFPDVERACREAGRPIYAALFPFEVERLIATKRFPGQWTQIGTVRHVSFWKYEPAMPLAEGTR